jgi:hypothetical protein
MPRPVGYSFQAPGISPVPAPTNAKVSQVFYPSIDFIMTRLGILITWAAIDYMHWVAKTPSNLQAFGLCSKDTYATLRLADGTAIVSQNGFTGSWSGAGGDVGRYTP